MAPKPKPRKKTVRRPAPPVKSAPIPAAPDIPEKPGTPWAWTLAFPILVALGAAAFYRFHPALGWGLMAAAALTAWKANAVAPGSLPRWGAFLWASGFILVLWGFSGTLAMTVANPYHPAFVPSHALPAGAAGFILLLGAWGWMRFDPAPNRESWPWMYRLGLLAILVAAAYLRLKTWRDPDFRYWFDYSLSMQEARTAVDFRTERYLIWPFGSRQPVYLYLAAMGYALFPKISSLVLLKGLWALWDLASIWVHYLLGKEVGGRRAGILLAAAMAFSKPMMQICMTAEPPISTTLCIGLMLLFTVRFWKKPDLRHALQWGIAVGFGAYGYNTVRPFLWWIPILVVLFTIYRTRASQSWKIWAFGLGSLLAWSWFFVKFNGFLPKALAVSFLAGPVVSWIFVLSLVALGVRIHRDGKGGDSNTWVAPMLGLAIAALLVAPMVTHPLYAGYIDTYSASNAKHPFYPTGGMTLDYLLGRVLKAYQELFISFSDRGDMAITNEAFFSLQSVPWVFAGFAYALSKPRRINLLLLLTFGIGLIPHLMSLLSHSGRLLGILAPLFLLGALATDLFLRNLKRGGVAHILGILALASYFGWSVRILDYRTYTVMRDNPSCEYTVFTSLRNEKPGTRIYVWDDGNWCSLYALSGMVDNREVFRLSDDGEEVPAPAGQPSPDIAIYFNGTRPEILGRLRREFPLGGSQEIFMANQPPGQKLPAVDCYRIPGSEIKEYSGHGPKPLFVLTVPPPNSWRVLHYGFRNGLGYGTLDKEEWVQGALGPMVKVQPMQSVRATGNFEVPRTGIYRFSVNTGNYAVLDVDGKRVLDVRPTYPAVLDQVREIKLGQGRHDVLLRSFLQRGLALPPILVRFPGEKDDHPLGTF